MAELNHLKQTGGVEEYQSIFEELRSLVKEIEPSLTESFYIRSFMGGLQKELRNTVQTYKPTTLEQAISLAGLLEGAFDNLITKAKSQKPIPLKVWYKYPFQLEPLKNFHHFFTLVL